MLKYFTITLITLTLFSISDNIYTAEKEYKPYTDIGYIEKSNLTIKQVVDSPDKFHRDIITLDGKVKDLDYKKLLTGRKFTIFKLSDGMDNEVKVYARGFVKVLGEGTKIRIHGRYSKEKSFLMKTYPNVMKARKVFVIDS